MANQSVLINIDFARVRESFEECPEILSHVARLFREDYVSDMRGLRQALDHGDSARFAFLAHKIRGSVSYFRVDALVNLAAELESRGECCDLIGADGLVGQLSEGLDSVSAVLKDEEERLASRGSTDTP